MSKEGLFDRIIQHQVGLERAKAGEIKRVKKIISRLDDDIEREVLKLKDNYTKKDIDNLIKKISTTTTYFHSRTLKKVFEGISSTVIGFETEFAFKTVEGYLEGKGATVKPNPVIVLNKVNQKKFQGRKLSEWNNRLGKDKVARISLQLKTIAAENGNKNELLIGTRNAIRTSNNNSQAVTRAYFDQASSLSRDEVYLQNDSKVKELIWISILDNSTTLTCAVRSNQRYNAITKEPIGHDNEWGEGAGRIHFGCRSIAIPVDENDIITSGAEEGFKFEEGTKTAIGAEKDYERGDDKTSEGKKYKLPSKNNKLQKQLVDANVNYETWLKRQPRAFVQDVLGTNRAKRFLDRNEKLSSFVIPDGTELTVKQLNKRLGKI